jgi:MFS family permease
MRKWVVVTLVSLVSFLTNASSSIVAPALSEIAAELHINKQIELSLVFAIFGMGFIVGALPFGPLSELYGQAPILHCSFFFFFLMFNLASGFAQTKKQLIVFRLFAGIGGSAPSTISLPNAVMAMLTRIGWCCIVVDCFTAENIGRGSAFYGLAPRLGPALGPLIGGFIVENLGWRWCFHITSTLAGALFIFEVIFT